ncbi:MAG: nucleotidyltransferase [Treponema sp. GWB1_62_6]|nr:MAG: nucleotidyltransferase [Treponema sp. GWB1_62_6]OHE65011.1 MAG: nucleotidyltransferase [Treponema sp. GWC1_61_84]HCM26020.1 nucleotidyltransferase [Treponema sp.]
MTDDVRWKQRLQNLARSADTLESALGIENPDIIQRAGLIQFFEMSFELSWNAMKDYLEAQGFNDVATPRKAVKKAFEIGLVDDGSIWLQGLEDRNLTSHTYNEKVAQEVISLIREKYFPAILRLISSLNEEAR